MAALILLRRLLELTLDDEAMSRTESRALTSAQLDVKALFPRPVAPMSALTRPVMAA